MASSSYLMTIVATPGYHTPKFISKIGPRFGMVSYSYPLNLSLRAKNCQIAVPLSSSLRSNVEGDDDKEEGPVQDLRVPIHWLEPSIAAEESEWLRATLHKWLDDEYCPEPTNIDISNAAARSYYKSLVEKETDLGEILLNMARELESISYQESFHGAFSSANAAIDLIIRKIEQVY